MVCSRRPVVVPTECPPTKNHGPPRAPQTESLRTAAAANAQLANIYRPSGGLNEVQHFGRQLGESCHLFMLPAVLQKSHKWQSPEFRVKSGEVPHLLGNHGQDPLLTLPGKNVALFQKPAQSAQSLQHSSPKNTTKIKFSFMSPGLPDRLEVNTIILFQHKISILLGHLHKFLLCQWQQN